MQGRRKEGVSASNNTSEDIPKNKMPERKHRELILDVHGTQTGFWTTAQLPGARTGGVEDCLVTVVGVFLGQEKEWKLRHKLQLVAYKIAQSNPTMHG
jgi:hypothetical protein